jgi:hypothetical protein
VIPSDTHGHCFKLNRFPSLVCIALLPSLSGSHIFLDSTNLSFGFFYKVNTVKSPFPRFHLVQRSSTLVSIQSFKRCHFDTHLITIVVRELSKWQPFLPRSLARDNARSKHVFKNLIHMLSLPRGLWMICRTTD